MFRDNEFRWLHGDYRHLSILSYPATLGLSEADANAGTMRRGKGMRFADNSDVNAAFSSINDFFGILMHPVNLNGTTDATGFRDFVMNKLDLPRKRGSKVLLRQPLPGCMIELEDADSQTVGIDRLLVTSGTGAISAATPLHTPLTYEDGALRVAQSGAGVNEMVFARIKRANLTPVTAGQIRVRVEFVSPYLFTADT